MAFDYEFDTPVHVECIAKALEQDPDHPEAICMRYLLVEPDHLEERARRLRLMKKVISGQIKGYVIRHPSGGVGNLAAYIRGDDHNELKAAWYEGFNPVYALVALDLDSDYSSEREKEEG
jgi:hypothetical protein